LNKGSVSLTVVFTAYVFALRIKKNLFCGAAVAAAALSDDDDDE